MVSAVNSADAEHFRVKLDLSNYHRARYFDELLMTRSGVKANTIDIALPGQCPSDALMMLGAESRICGRPDLVIYGIAPRDFIDNTLVNPMDTEHSQYLRRIVKPVGLKHIVCRDVWFGIDWQLKQTIFLYNKSLDFQIMARDGLARLLDRFIPMPASTKPFTYWDRIKLLPNYHAGELKETAMIVSPMDEESNGDLFKDNTVEYIERYKHAKDDNFLLQLYFLRLLSAFCVNRDIKLVVVNMPLTVKNIGLLGEPKYRQYLSRLEEFSRTYEVEFIDMNDQKRFSNSDFNDLVHLNGTGGMKFFGLLADRLHMRHLPQTITSAQH